MRVAVEMRNQNIESVPGTFNSETNTLSVTVDGTPHNYVLLEEAFVPVGADGDASPSFVVGAF